MLEKKRMAAMLLVTVGLVGCAAEDDIASAGPNELDAVAEQSVDDALVGPGCLVGDWFIEQDQMQVFYDALGAENGNLDFTIEGGTGLSFTETTFSYTPEFTLLLNVMGMDGSGTITGAIGGDYTADSELITTSQETNDTALTVTVGGVTQAGDGLFDSLLASSPIRSAAYECNEQGPLIEFDTGGTPQPIQLTRR